MGTHIRVLGESFPMSTHLTVFKWFSKNICAPVLWRKVALALEELIQHVKGQMHHHDDLGSISISEISGTATDISQPIRGRAGSHSISTTSDNGSLYTQTQAIF